MSPDHHPSAEEIFDHAAGLPAAERAAYLDQACSEDAVLRSEVEGLLAADSSAGDAFLAGDTAFRDLTEALAREVADTPQEGTRVGSWELRGELGTGGMGTVHLAERITDDFTQRVAIKLVRPGMDTKEILQRFRQERQVLAGLEHPNIARLIDGGVTANNRPYLVMEYVDGRPIDQHCREQELDNEAVLRLFVEVCRAVSHAHRHLVVHRDLKPSNVMVTDRGQCKLLDFGIAKVLDPEAVDSGLTMTAARLLSPRYASPEQVAGRTVTTASDVYALGVILYELLAGRSPYPDTKGSLADLEKHVREHQPAPPSTVVAGPFPVVGAPPARRNLGADLGADLDAIVLKALRKEPERRYDSVDALTEDVARYLDGRPVLARPDSVNYRVGKFVRRNLAAVAVTLVALVLVTGAAVVSTVQYLRADRQQRTAEQVGGFLQEMLASIDPEVARGQDTALLKSLLDRAAHDLDENRVPDRRAAAGLHGTVGRTYASIAAYDEAIRHLEQTLELSRGNSEKLVALKDLGHAQFDAGRYQDAETHLTAALALPQAGPDDLAAHALVHHHLGKVYEAIGRYDQAEEHQRTAVKELADRTDVAARADVVRGLGVFLMYNKQAYAEADSLFRLALELCETTPGTGVLVAPVTRMSLSTNHRYRGDLEAAATLGREALAGYAAVLPADHPSLGSAKDLLAGILEQQEHWGEAEVLYRESLANLRGALGPDHRDVGTVANNLAGLLRKTDRPDEAAPFYAEAVRIYTTVLGPDHAWVGIILASVADNEARRGRWTAAEEIAEECLRVRRLHWDDDHWRVAVIQNLRGECLLRRGDLAGAETALTASHTTLLAARGENHSSVLRSRRRLDDLAAAQAGASPSSRR